VTKASDLLVAALENEGVGCIFAIPGEENLDVLESLRHSKIKLVLTRHTAPASPIRCCSTTRWRRWAPVFLRRSRHR